MKASLLLFALCASLATTASAKAPHAKLPTPDVTRSARNGAERYVRYLSTALALNGAQLQAVRRLAAERALAAQAQPAATAQAQFERSLLLVLDAGQYNAYRWLAESQPR